MSKLANFLLFFFVAIKTGLTDNGSFPHPSLHYKTFWGQFHAPSYHKSLIEREEEDGEKPPEFCAVVATEDKKKKKFTATL